MLLKLFPTIISCFNLVVLVLWLLCYFLWQSAFLTTFYTFAYSIRIDSNARSFGSFCFAWQLHCIAVLCFFFQFRKSFFFVLYLARNTFEFNMKKWQKDSDASTVFLAYITHTSCIRKRYKFILHTHDDKIFVRLNMTKFEKNLAELCCCIHWIQT